SLYATISGCVKVYVAETSLVSQMSSMVQVMVTEPPSQSTMDWSVKSLVTVGEPPFRLLLITSVCSATHAAISASRAAWATAGSASLNSQASAVSLLGSVKLMPSGCVKVYVASTVVVPQISSMVHVIVMESEEQNTIDWSAKLFVTVGEQPPVKLLLMMSVCALTQAAISASRFACAIEASSSSNSESDEESSDGSV